MSIERGQWIGLNVFNCYRLHGLPWFICGSYHVLPHKSIRFKTSDDYRSKTRYRLLKFQKRSCSSKSLYDDLLGHFAFFMSWIHFTQKFVWFSFQVSQFHNLIFSLRFYVFINLTQVSLSWLFLPLKCYAKISPLFFCHYFLYNKINEKIGVRLCHF